VVSNDTLMKNEGEGKNSVPETQGHYILRLMDVSRATSIAPSQTPLAPTSGSLDVVLFALRLLSRRWQRRQHSSWG